MSLEFIDGEPERARRSEPLAPVLAGVGMTTTYVVRRPLLDLARRIRRSPFAADIHAGLRNRFLPGIGAFVAFFFALMVFRGVLVAADIAGILP